MTPERKNEIRDAWSRKVGYLANDRMDEDEVVEYVLSLLDEEVEKARGEEKNDVVAEIGAKLLAKHSSQAILDAYFDSANEVLEQK